MEDNMQAPARVEIQDEIAIITMDDGKANAINPPMLEALHACLDRAEADAKVVLITGRPGRFSAGFDLKLMAASPGEEVKALVDNGGVLAHRLYGFSKPVIAACNGHGIAMGCFILMSCDVRIGVQGDFKLGANETQINMVLPIFAEELLRARVPRHMLTKTGIIGHLYDPDSAIAAGFLDQVVPPEALLDTAMAQARALVAVSGSAYMGNKRLLRADTLARIASSLPD